jgi:hypothetical protein
MIKQSLFLVSKDQVLEIAGAQITVGDNTLGLWNPMLALEGTSIPYRFGYKNGDKNQKVKIYWATGNVWTYIENH